MTKNNENSVNFHRQFLVNILHTADWLDQKISGVLKNHDLTHVQFNVLRLLQAVHPAPMSVNEVKDKILFSNSDISRLMDRLADKKMIERKICPTNRRKAELRISQQGLKVLDRVMPELETELEGYYHQKAGLEEVRRATALLQKIRTNNENYQNANHEEEH